MRARDTALTRLISFGAVAGVVGGLLRVAAAFIPYTPAAAWLEALYGAVDLGLLFGLIAVYLAAAERVGLSGLAAFACALAALASIVGPDPQAFGVDFYRVGAAAFALALAAFGATLLAARVFMIPAASWIACAAFGVVAAATGSAPAFVGAGLALGLGFIAAGVMLVRSPDAPRGAAG
jgi:hypothetical protein